MAIIHATPEPNGILLLTFNGVVASDADVQQLKTDIDTVSSSIRSLHKAQGQGIRILLNISNFDAEVVMEAVTALVNFARADKEYVFRTAIFGASKKLKVIGDSIVTLSGRSNIKFFETKEEAMHWLDGSGNVI